MSNNATPFEIIGNLDLRKIADDELAVIIKKLTEEQAERKHNAYSLAWKELVEHIKEFCKEFGEISVENDIYIDENRDFSHIAEIW